MAESSVRAELSEMEIERICTAFEQEHRQGTPALSRLPAILRSVPLALREQCLESLLAMDLEYRWKKGEVSIQDYATLFPDDQEIIHRVFDVAQRTCPPTGCEQLISPIHRSGLLSYADVQAFLEALPAAERPSDARSLAEKLVQAGRLTKFQASQLLTGNGMELVRGDYVIERRIGGGGMGDVYQAYQRSMSRRVAYKVIKDNKNHQLRDRFQREVKICGMLETDHIVRAYHTGEYLRTRYLVTALIEGGDLATLVRERGAMPGTAAVECLKQIAAGLIHAHRLRIIHRDLKPGNILWDVRLQRAAIADWGLARCQEDTQMRDGRPIPADESSASAISSPGGFVGTPGFAPREQRAGESSDERSDIYALGKTLYCLVAGTVMPREAEHLTFGAGDFVSGLDEIYRDMVADDPNDRYRTVADLLEDLCRIQPTPRIGQDSMQRWMAKTPNFVPESTRRPSFFSEPTQPETFIRKTISRELSRSEAKERLRTVLADAERWQPPTD